MRYKIEVYAANGTTLLYLLDNSLPGCPLISLDFELFRDGGCGAFNLTCKSVMAYTSFVYRGKVVIYFDPTDSGTLTKWFTGYIQRKPVNASGTAGIYNVSGYGYFGQINWVDLVAFYLDKTIDYIAEDLLTTYINPQTDISADTSLIVSPAYTVGQYELLDNDDGKQALANLAYLAGSTEYGVDADQKLYFRAYDTTMYEKFFIGTHILDYDPQGDDTGLITRLIVKGGFVNGAGTYEYVINADGTDVPDAQTAYGIREKRVSAPQLQTEADVLRWGINYLTVESVPKRSIGVDIKSLQRLRWPKGNAGIYTATGTLLETLAIYSIKYTLAGNVLSGKMTLGDRPPSYNDKLIGIIREAKAKSELQNIETRESIFSNGLSLDFANRLRLYAKQERLFGGVMWDDFKNLNGLDKLAGLDIYVVGKYDVVAGGISIYGVRKDTSEILWTNNYSGGDDVWWDVCVDSEYCYLAYNETIYKLSIIDGSEITTAQPISNKYDPRVLTEDETYLYVFAIPEVGAVPLSCYVAQVKKSDLSIGNWWVYFDPNEWIYPKAIVNDGDNVYCGFVNLSTGNHHIISLAKSNGAENWDTADGGAWSDEIIELFSIVEDDGAHIFSVQENGDMREMKSDGNMWYSGAVKNYGAFPVAGSWFLGYAGIKADLNNIYINNGTDLFIINRESYAMYETIALGQNCRHLLIDALNVYMLLYSSAATICNLPMRDKFSPENTNSFDVGDTDDELMVGDSVSKKFVHLNIRKYNDILPGLFVDYKQYHKYSLQEILLKNHTTPREPGRTRNKDGTYTESDVLVMADYNTAVDTSFYVSRDNGVSWALASYTSETPLDTALTGYSVGDGPAAPYYTIDGTWKIRDDTGNAWRTEEAGVNILLFNRLYYNYYEIQAEVKNSTAADTPNPGIIIGYTDIDNYDMVYIGVSGDTVNYGRCRNGIFETMESAAVTIAQNTYYTVKAICKEDYAEIYIDTVLLLTIKRDLLGGGGAGLIAQNQINATDYCYFKDISFTIYEKMWADLTGQTTGDDGKNIKIKVVAKPGANIRAAGCAF